ncbi:MAG: glycosyltransferase family 4 protein [Frankiaceae bacterium]|nr:glycosyltransferase family 4 protein [Frankiaceae bacterium]
MRVALIAPPWVPVPPPAYGGTEAVIDRIARGLLRCGHEVVLAAAANSTTPAPQVKGTEHAPDTASLVTDVATELRHVLTGYAALDGEVDLVHDHTLAGPLLGRQPVGAAMVTTNHGPFDRALKPLYAAMVGTAITAISHHQASTAGEVAIRAVIHHGIDVDDVAQGTGTGGYASFLGRMTPDKGPRQAALVARAAGVPLRMAAKIREPAERDYFDLAVRPLLCSDVEYVGELGLHDKLGLLRESFALLNPLQWPEPFGLVMIEALACGTPVIATPCGSAPEIVDDGVTGYLRTQREDLAGALLDAVNLDRVACRSVAVNRFSSDRMVADYVQLYEELLEVDAESQRPARIT